MEIKPALLTVKEYAAYMNIGETKARELLKSPKCTYRVQIGNRVYAHKKLLDEWLINQTKRH